MSTLFHPITRQAALADVADLPHRIRATTYTTKRGPEGRTHSARAGSPTTALAPAIPHHEPEGPSMSIDAIHIAKRAERAVLPLLTELLATGEQENRIALGELYSGDEYIQVQLVVTSRPEDLLDDDSVMGDEA